MYVNNNAYNASAAYQTTKTTVNIKGSYLDITGGASAATGVQDGVDLSDQVQEMLDRIKNLDVFKIIYPNSDPRQKTKSLDEVKSDFMADFNDFSGTFGKMSALMGLDSSQSFTMGLNGVGGMTVEGGVGADKLQSAFNNNSTLVARFAVMAARGSLADAGESVPGFKEAYAQDPVAAIKDNIGALKDLLLGFRTVSNADGMSYGFMRDFELDIEHTTTSAAVA